MFDRLLLSNLLNEISLFMDLLGENPFKVRAHQSAARLIETFDGELEETIKSGQIGEQKGIGPALKEKIEEFYKTGTIKEHTHLKSKLPSGLMDMVKIPSLGPKKVKTIYEKLGISSVGELEYACKENRLSLLEGFGKASQAKILKNIEFMKQNQDAFLFSDAWLEAQTILTPLKKVVEKIEVTGALRRRCEIVRQIDLLAITDQPQALVKKFTGLPNVANIKSAGETKITAVLKNGMNCEVQIFESEDFAHALLFLTGSREHYAELQNKAQSLGINLKAHSFATEEQIYERLGLSYIAPELRENLGEIEAAEQKRLPVLIERDQIRGVFHCHTNESDGVNSLEEMVKAAQDLGLEYIGISDHSASSEVYANGLKKERVLKQFQKISEVQKKFKIKILRGIESDILSDGSLDYDQDLLKKFDFIIGSVHSSFTMPEEKMTARVLKAINNPFLDFLGHPTGRLLLAREGFAINLHQVIEQAAKLGVVIELNSHPNRLDVDWRYGNFIKEKKALVSINPDAHSAAGIEDIEYGVGIARKAGLEQKQVLNTLPLKSVVNLLRRNKSHGARST